jgi:double-stranded uracil-DNA glycosylase
MLASSSIKSGPMVDPDSTSGPSLPSGIPDLVGPNLRVLFCGINPGLVSASTGLHFARAGNRFWKILFGAGFTDRVLRPEEQNTLLTLQIGITNLVERPTANASTLTPAELRQGAETLEERVRPWSPRVIAFLGMQAYRTGFHRPKAALGRQEERIGQSGIWLLPNPSGAQARYQLNELIDLFAELRLSDLVQAE